MKIEGSILYITDEELNDTPHTTPALFFKMLDSQISEKLAGVNPVTVVALGKGIHPRGWGECPVCGLAAVWGEIGRLSVRVDDDTTTNAKWEFSEGWYHLYNRQFATMRKHVSLDEIMRYNSGGGFQRIIRNIQYANWALFHPFKLLKYFRIDPIEDADKFK